MRHACAYNNQNQKSLCLQKTKPHMAVPVIDIVEVLVVHGDATTSLLVQMCGSLKALLLAYRQAPCHVVLHVVVHDFPEAAVLGRALADEVSSTAAAIQLKVTCVEPKSGGWSLSALRNLGTCLVPRPRLYVFRDPDLWVHPAYGAAMANALDTFQKQWFHPVVGMRVWQGSPAGVKAWSQASDHSLLVADACRDRDDPRADVTNCIVAVRAEVFWAVQGFDEDGETLSHKLESATGQGPCSPPPDFAHPLALVSIRLPVASRTSEAATAVTSATPTSHSLAALHLALWQESTLTNLFV